MVRITFIRLSQLIYYTIIIVLAVAVVCLAVRFMSKNTKTETNEPASIQYGKVQQMDNSTKEEASINPNSPKNQIIVSSRGTARPSDNEDNNGTSYQNVIENTLPVLKQESAPPKNTIFISVWNWVLNVNLKDPKTILAYLMPVMKGVNVQEAVAAVAQQTTPDEGEEELYLKNDETIPEEIKIEIAKIKDDYKPVEVTGEGPQVLIYHSHSREAYAQSPKDKYVVAGNFRTTDSMHSVRRVGDEVARVLKETYGVDVLHDRSDHELPYTAAYNLSLKTILADKEKYPSLKMFVDIHRDAFEAGKKSKDSEVVTIDGKRVAKVMVVIGTGKGQTGKGFSVKPKWQENYKLAKKITDELNGIKPGLAKPVLVKSGRYNQHVSTNAILIEVGSNLTTLEEADAAAPYIAQALKGAMK